MTELPLLRQSERATFKRCQQRWWWSYVDDLEPISPKGMEAADFGTIFHVGLAEYYLPGTKRGPHPAETWAKLASDVKASVRAGGDDELAAKWEDFYELGLLLCEEYVKRYQGDPHWDVLDAERRFSVLIPDVTVPRVESKKGRRIYKPIVRLVGTIDLCVRDLNQERKGRPVIKMVDHKTVARIETHHLTLDEQPSTYIAVGTHALREQGLIEQDEAIAGMEWNFIKRAAIDNRPRDDKGMARNKPVKKHYGEAIGHLLAKPVEKYSIADLEITAAAHGITVYGDVSQDQSGDNFLRHFVPRTPAERQRQIVRISQEARVMDMVRTGKLPVLKTPQKDCYYCPYFDLCELDEGNGDTEYFIQTTMKKRDPYADHRDGAENSKKVNECEDDV